MLQSRFQIAKEEKPDGKALVNAHALEMGRVVYGRALTEIIPKRSHFLRILFKTGTQHMAVVRMKHLV